MEADRIIKLLKSQKDIADIVFDKEVELDLKGIDFASGNFVNCTFNFEFTILNHNAQASYLNFTNCTFINSFEYRNSNNDSIHKFENCKFSNTRFYDVNFEDLIIDNCILTGSFTFYKSSIDNVSIIKPFAQPNGLIGVYSKEIELLEIDSNDAKINVRLVEFSKAELTGTFKRISIDAKEFESLEIIGNDDKSTIEKFELLGINFSGNVSVLNQFIEKLDFSYSNQKSGNFILTEVFIDSCAINGCTFSNFYLNQVKFNSPPNFNESDLSNIKLSNIKWFDKIRSLQNSFLDEKIKIFYKLRKKYLSEENVFEEDEVSDLKYQHETYRQLKVASIANHNLIDTLVFYQNEMNLYWKLIRIEGGVSWYDHLLIFLNRIVSNFGQNWFSPLMWLFIFHFIFYSSLLSWNYFGNNWSGSDEFGQFWVLLNPIHKTPCYIDSGMGHFTEFIMRVMGGYFIYHFIKASRKFGKV